MYSFEIDSDHQTSHRTTLTTKFFFMKPKNWNQIVGPNTYLEHGRSLHKLDNSIYSFRFCISNLKIFLWKSSQILVKESERILAETANETKSDCCTKRNFPPDQTMNKWNYLLLSLEILEMERKSDLWSNVSIFHSLMKLSILLKEGMMLSVTFPMIEKSSAFL